MNCNVSSAWRDQMSLSDSVATATENASKLGYKHVCVNYLHMASHDYQYQEVMQHIHTLTHRIVLFFLAQLPLLFQHEFKWRMKVPNIIESKTCHKHVISRQKKGFEDTKVQKANIAR